MQRLILALLLLGLLAGGTAAIVAGVRLALRSEADGLPVPREAPMQKLAFAALLLVILGAATGWLGGL